jgi:hypothetical protein
MIITRDRGTAARGVEHEGAMANQTVHDEHALALAIRSGAEHRPRQSFGAYFDAFGGSCALGAAYEGVYRLPEEVAGEIPHRLDRFFHCLENVSKRCPAGCHKVIPIGAMIVHLNDDHEWTREQIAAWLDGAVPAVSAKKDSTNQDGQGTGS